MIKHGSDICLLFAQIAHEKLTKMNTCMASRKSYLVFIFLKFTRKVGSNINIALNNLSSLQGPISHPVVKSVVKCMVITRLSK